MNDDDRTPDTPAFDSPPVIETALGVEFKPLDSWSIPHFGLFWERIREEFPSYTVQPPLASQIETFSQGPAIPGPYQMDFQLFLQPDVRCWFFHSEQERLIQVQRDRFIHNWRKIGDHIYPRYHTIRPKFQDSWKTFLDFLKSERITTPEVAQCEVSYINHIEIEQPWKSMADLADMFPVWAGVRTDGFLPTPEVVQLATSFAIADGGGRLRINLQPAIRTTDLRQVLQLTVSARGVPRSSDTDAILDWLDLGHLWVVRGFADFTSTKMHSLWKRRP
jgi:uncharacterized protein (TIGR04255 family)